MIENDEATQQKSGGYFQIVLLLYFYISNPTMRPLIFALFLVLFGLPSFAQDTTAFQVAEAMPLAKEASIKKLKFQPDPKRAGLYAALIPGMGQLYNRQYWKMPIVFATMGTTIYFVIKRNNEYQRYRKAYVSRIAFGTNSTDEFQGVLSTEGIKQYQDEAKQSMDMMVVYTLIGYAGQIMEAISAAHLRNFDISKDLSMQVRPLLTPINTFGVGLVVNFKK